MNSEMLREEYTNAFVRSSYCDLQFSCISDAGTISTDSSDFCISRDIATLKGGSSHFCQGLFQCPWGEMSIREQEGEKLVRGSAEARLCKAVWSSHGS